MDVHQEGVNNLLQLLLEPAPLLTKLDGITNGIVEYFKADFCRIWLIRPGDLCELGCVHAEAKEGAHVCSSRHKCLHLLASSGRYTHLDGAVHRRVPYGCYKIGEIASGEARRFLLSDVVSDPRVHDREWARNLGLVSFAGYQIRTPNGETGGVLALFSMHPISPMENSLLDGLSKAIAFAVQQSVTEETLHLQAVELEQEIAERQKAQESMAAQSLLLKSEIEERRTTQNELTKLNAILEQRVQDRTVELVEKNAKLHKAYEELKNVQAQLLHKDKMASIGQLAAGVAHEINNPMGFIISNLTSLSKYVDKLITYMDVTEQRFTDSESVTSEHLARLRKTQKINLICQDLPELIAESRAGAERISKIVQDLKSFSWIDNSDFEFCDINEGLESTLTVVWSELKYKAIVNREYGRLPQVWCNMGQLNQVFLNLLLNAAHAINGMGEIGISTRTEEESVIISISDNGCGIAPENIKRIFDPFFTTKEVGTGTGLGLAIAYDVVVHKHGGFIGVTSEIGAGAKFTITLPLKMKISK